MKAERYYWDCLLSRPHASGCRACGRDPVGPDFLLNICIYCQQMVKAIVSPPKPNPQGMVSHIRRRENRRRVMSLISRVNSVNILELALVNAPTGWRNLVVRRRLAELSAIQEAKAKGVET